LKVASLRRRLLSKPPAECFSGDDRSTLEELHDLGFSEEFIDGFFRPFLGGVFLERELETSAHLFRYYFRCFAEGDAAVPAQGMQALPEQLASSLEGCVSLGVRARAADASHVVLDDGSSISADHVVVAADGASASALTGGERPSYKPSVTAYYACDDPPVSEPILILDGEGTGPVNHVAAMSAVSSDYAPPGRHLVAASGVGSAADDPKRFRVEAPRQLSRWFGSSVEGWTHLKTYVIPHALPRHPAGSLTGTRWPHRRPDGVIVAGGYTEFGSLQGALSSGRRAAEVVLELRPVPTPQTGRARPTAGTHRPEPLSSTGTDR